MTSNERYDVLIIGGGPAGIAASIWCSDLGLSSILVDSGPELGGQMQWIYNSINNYPGVSVKNGMEMGDRFIESIDLANQCVLLNSKVLALDATKVEAFLSDKTTLSARYAIVATGLRRRKLGIPGEQEFIGRGVLESGARDRAIAAGKRVAIIGGGDAAIENALILSEFADRVFVIHRRNELRARKEFADRVHRVGNVEIVLDRRVTSIEGGDVLERIYVDDANGSRSSLEIDLVLIRVGYQPNSEILRGQVEIDEHGYVTTDRFGQTSAPSVFAVGDVANQVSPTIATAVGTSAMAVKSIYSLISGDSRV